MSWGFQILFTLSSQLIGIALAGLFRRFLTWYGPENIIHRRKLTIFPRPAAMLWPNQFSNISLFFALHDKSRSNPAEANGWRISRYRWFLYIMMGGFTWYWYALNGQISFLVLIGPRLPGLLGQGLSVFAFLTCKHPYSLTFQAND